MKILAQRETLLPPLMQVTGVVERRQTLPILSNILINARQNAITLTATDLEIEMTTTVEAECSEEGAFTLPARKLMDICKALPSGSELILEISNERATLRSGKSRFSLGMLPAADYPAIEPTPAEQVFTVEERVLKRLIQKTSFAMAQQDVRYYLNGMLFEARPGMIRVVATDGHRLALSEKAVDLSPDMDIQVIVPRKAVLELGRLLEDEERPVKIELSSNHIRFRLDSTVFLSKLIDGRFPDYQRVIPAESKNELVIDRETLRQALARASILSNEKYRGIRFHLQPDVLQLQAHNPEKEEAEEELTVDYSGSNIDIGFNVGYLLDVLGVLETDQVVIGLNDANSSALITGEDEEGDRYVVMPMKL